MTIGNFSIHPWLFVLVFSSATLADDKQGQVLFNGKNFDGWKLKGDNSDRGKWTVGQAAMDEKNNRNLLVTTAFVLISS